MWFKNTNTGHIWKITDERQIQELKKSNHFTEVNRSEDGLDSSDTKQEKDKPEFECEICGKECKNQRSYSQHKRMAHNIDKHGNTIDTSKYNAKFNNNLKDEEDGDKE